MKFLTPSKLILFGYATLISFLLISIFIFKSNDETIAKDYEKLVSSQSLANLMQQMQVNAKNRSILLSQILYEKDPFIQDELIQQFQIQGNLFITHKLKLSEIGLGLDKLNRLNQLNEVITKNSSRQQRVIVLYLDDKTSESQGLYLEMLPYQRKVISTLSGLSDELRQQASNAQAHYHHITEQDERLSAFLNASLLVSMLFFAIYSFRQSKRTEKKLNDNVSELNTQIEEQQHVNAMDAHILHAVEQSIVLTTRKGEIVRSNPSFELYLKQLRTDLPPSIWQILNQAGLNINREQICFQIDQTGLWQKEIQLGEPFNFYALCEINRFEPTKLISANLLISIKNISALKEAQRAIEKQANYDAITELPNRHSFQQRLAEQTKSSNANFSLIYLDLDDFKNINDRLGHDYGDELLKAVSFRMQNLLLELHLNRFQLSRIGGDEFAILLEDCNKKLKDCSKNLAEQLVDIISQPYNIQEEVVEIGCSIGISIFPEHSQTARQLMRNADLAMYEAKHSGKNCFAFYTEEINQRLEQKNILLQNIESALLKKDFVLHYQPQYNLQTNELIGLEALIRWESEDTCYRPNEFIPFAEENGMIHLIDEYVIKLACRQLHSWQEEGIKAPRIAINISSKQSNPENLINLIDSQIEKYGLNGKSLELEVTEYSLITNIEDKGFKESWLTALHNRGIHIAIDDFGTGYSSLSYLQNLRVDRLKIDRGFINGIITNKESLLITESIIQLAHNVGAKVIAEGVETKEQSQLLINQGCDEAQGYLYNPALPVDKIRPLLNQNSPVNCL